MADMRGRVCVVTGANSGIGKATAQGLAAAGATVLMVCRDRTRGTAAQQEIITATGNSAVELWQADLASLADVRRLAGELLAAHPAIHVLINNAAVRGQSSGAVPADAPAGAGTRGRGAVAGGQRQLARAHHGQHRFR
jgi:NAD(P)-dependent dehydrogenase (short-subunit alcohol dehydrogenase family)